MGFGSAIRSLGRRRTVQALSLIAWHSSWGPAFLWVCVPVLSCHSCALAWFACPIGVLIHYSGYRVFPYLALGTVLLFAGVLGRFLCGWVCPFGTVQDLLHRIPSRKIVLPRWTGSIKYGLLAVTVFILPFFLGQSTLASFCRICPASALQVTIPNLILGSSQVTGLTIVKLSVLVMVLFLSVASSRGFCNMLCPLGALLAPLNRWSLLSVQPTEHCIACGRCDKTCPTHVNPSSRSQRGIPTNRANDCIVCQECEKVCPMAKASQTDSPLG